MGQIRQQLGVAEITINDLEGFFMNKNELINKVADKTGIAKKDTEAIVNEALSQVIEALKQNEKVQLVGFGTFEVRERASRSGRNPQTGETITIPATRVPGFRAGNKFKDAVKK
jgi:DNA-binding protein HU-beta